MIITHDESRGPDEEEEAPEEEEEQTEELEKPKAATPAKPVKTLPGNALRHLRALGHDLAPVVMVGKEGITESLVRATNAALLTHELIKVKVQGEAPLDRKAAAAALAVEADAVLAQVIGRMFLLYKRNPKKQKIKLPK